MESEQLLISDRFARSSRYHPEWIKASASGGANALWLTEWLAGALDLRPSMVRDAREAYGDDLRRIEGDETFEGQQRFFDIAARLTEQRRLSRLAFSAGRI